MTGVEQRLVVSVPPKGVVVTGLLKAQHAIADYCASMITAAATAFVVVALARGIERSTLFEGVQVIPGPALPEP